MANYAKAVQREVWRFSQVTKKELPQLFKVHGSLPNLQKFIGSKLVCLVFILIVSIAIIDEGLIYMVA